MPTKRVLSNLSLSAAVARRLITISKSSESNFKHVYSICIENRLQNRWDMSVYVPNMLNFDMVSRYIQGELYEQIKLHKPIKKPPIPGIAGVLMRRDFSILETP